MNLLEFYKDAKKYCIEHGFSDEIDFVKNRRFKQMNAERFFMECVYVILNSGMKNQIAEGIFKKFRDSYYKSEIHIQSALRVVSHQGKNRAIKEIWMRYRHHFEQLKMLQTTDEKLEFLESLPWIGPITKYHLARNLGMDVAKPDRHLQRIADKFNHKDVNEMCKEISEQTGDKIGVIDLILWRVMEQTSGEMLNGVVQSEDKHRAN